MDGIIQCDGTVSFQRLCHTGDLNGSGTIEVTTQGKFVQHGSVAAGSLTFRAADRATMQFGSVGAGNIIMLDGTDDRVSISTAPFSAAFKGFTESDTINVRSGPITSESYASSGDGTGTLLLSDGGDFVRSLTFVGNYSLSSFAFEHLSADYLSISLATQTHLVGGVSVTSTSPDTLTLIQNVAAYVIPVGIYSYVNGVAVPPASDRTRSTLVIPANSTGTVAIPAGYANVGIAAGSAATVTGGDASATIVGDGFNYVGAAPLVGSGSGDSTILDSAAAARIVVGSSGQSTVTATGANASVALGDAGHASIDLSGASSTLVAGTRSTVTVSARGDGETVSVGAGATGSVRSSGNNEALTFSQGGLLHVTLTGTGDTIGFDVAGLNAHSGGAMLRTTSTNTVSGSGGPATPTASPIQAAPT